MRILVLTGSPHESGLSAALADAFCEGATAAGHAIERFDTAKMTIQPCKGCYTCHAGRKPSSTAVSSSLGTDANSVAGSSAITDSKNDSNAEDCAKVDTTHSLCVIDDDMKYIWPHLRDCDVLVLVTPLYYFSFSAQLKTAIDRFFPLNETLKVLPKKACLLATCGNQNKWIAEGLTASYEAMCRHLSLDDAGRVISFACRDKAALQAGGYIEAAEKLGYGLTDTHH